MDNIFMGLAEVGAVIVHNGRRNEVQKIDDVYDFEAAYDLDFTPPKNKSDRAAVIAAAKAVSNLFGVEVTLGESAPYCTVIDGADVDTWCCTNVGESLAAAIEDLSQCREIKLLTKNQQQ